MGVKYGLIKTILRIHLFRYLHETFYRHGLECLQSSRSENMIITLIITEEAPTSCLSLTVFGAVVGGNTFSPLAPILGADQKTGNEVFHSVSLFVAASMIHNMIFE